ncbi:MAG: hypothetical protein HRU19_10225 [Pseudobacteriovorax sp.]|nr:hypothetical protein [Pseudobacteriovorax sp.]
MKLLATLFLGVGLILSCNKKNDDTGTSGTALDLTNTSSIKLNSAGSTVSISNTDLAGSSFTLPSGALESEIDVRVRVGESIANRFLADTLNSELDFTVESEGGALEIKPTSIVTLQEPLTVTLRTNTANFNFQKAAILYKGIDENGYWRTGLIAQEDINISADSVSFSSDYFGRFQLVAFETAVEKSISMTTQGAGPWYGIETDVYSQFVNPETTGPDLSFYLVNDKGVISDSTINGNSFTAAFDFDNLKTDFPSIYDGSNEAKIGLGIFSDDLEYGLWLDVRTSEDRFTARMLQRRLFTEVPATPIVIGDLVGNYIGSSATAKLSGSSNVLESASESVSIALAIEGDALSISGNIGDFSVTNGSFKVVSSEYGSRLGFLEGTITWDSQVYPAKILVTADRNALGLLVCTAESTELCVKGDNTGSYDARSYVYVILRRF